ncbi:MAG TPA: tol-pal system protein YbgF [Candidatus Sulfotelmatobacter sp.]|nr:tol-pal system protein YbgF [Candidatus Sulfotelmatobacter sp.]
MTCEEARAAFSDLYDGALSGAPLAVMDQHLQSCPACRAEWDAFLGTMQALGELGTAEPSPGFAARVRQQIEAPPWWSRLVRALFLPTRAKVPIQALALALVAFTAVMIYQLSPELRRQAEVPAVPQPPAKAAPPAQPSAPAPQPAPPSAGDTSRRTAAGRAEETAVTDARPEEERGAGKRIDLRTKADSLRSAQREQGRAVPSAPGVPAPMARREGEKDRGAPDAAGAPPGPVPAPGEAKELGKTAAQVEAARPAPPMPGARAKELEPGVAGRGPGESAPTPGESRFMVSPSPAPSGPPGLAAPAPLKAQAPAPEAQIISAHAGSADELYSTGLTEFARQSYDQAAEAFRAFLAQHPRDARVPDARFWLAESYFGQRRYAEAIAVYETLLRQSPDSRRIPATLLKQGQARLALGDRAGCQLLQDVAGRFPNTREAAQAREALAALCP